MCSMLKRLAFPMSVLVSMFKWLAVLIMNLVAVAQCCLCTCSYALVTVSCLES